jgi:hypothetical protein
MAAVVRAARQGLALRAAAWRIAKLAWAAPCSLLGLVAALPLLFCGGHARRVAGTLEVTLRDCEADCPAVVRLLRFRAITLGHVILAVGRTDLEGLRTHELVHVRQYERWGIAFFAAYAASGLWQMLHGRSAYWHNHFEVQARLLSGERDGRAVG